ncbi:MAG: SpoIIE family protein phosphatase [Bacteroidales bacterium]
MIRKLYILLPATLLVFQLHGQLMQQGIPPVINYPPTITHGKEINWTIIQDNRGILYVGNDDNGVLEYDGSEWRTIPIANNSSVRSLAKSENGTIFVGAVQEFGYLAPDQSGEIHYVSLVPFLDSADRSFADVWKIYTTEDEVIFYSMRSIFIYSENTNELTTYRSPDHSLFGFYVDKRFFVGTFNRGLVEVLIHSDVRDSIVNVPGGDYYIQKDIYGLTAFDEEKLIIGTPGYGLSLYNTRTGEVDTDFAASETNSYLNKNFITHILELSNGNFLVSTIGGGLVVVSREGEIREIISKFAGLQDENIYLSYQNPGNYPYPFVWSALGFGVAKIGISSPLRSFNEDHGFQGLITAIESLDNILYIGTTSGIYRLTERAGFNSFEPVGSTNREVWEFQKFKLPNSEDVLLAIGAGGLQQIHKNGKTVTIDDQLLNVSKAEDMELNGFAVLQDPYRQNRIFVGRESSINYLTYRNGAWNQDYVRSKLKDKIRSLAFDGDQYLWFGTDLVGIARINPDDTTAIPEFFDTSDGLPSMGDNYVFNIDKKLYIGTIDGIYVPDKKNDTLSFEKDSVLNSYLPEGENAILKLYKDTEGAIWLSFKNSIQGEMIRLLVPDEGGKYNPVTTPFFGLEDFSTDDFHSINGREVWFSRSKKLYKFSKEIPIIESDFSALLRKVIIISDTTIFNGAYTKTDENGNLRITTVQDPGSIPQIKYSNNNIQFRWSSPYFDQEDKLEFSYFLTGFSKEWSDWENVLYQDFTNLPHGNYTFRIKAKNIYNDVSLEDTFSFVILRPWYLSFVAFLLYIIAAVLTVYIIIVLYTRRLKNENIRLEGIIQERTAEIRKQKEELTDSIEYASRIQRALLPPDKMLTNHGLEHFILFRPRDIVSGDFYWFGSNQGKVFIVAADCTGHGVPGAFMSMLGISFLDEIVIKSGVSETNKILDALRSHVITSLRQTGKSMDESTKDGMDLAMVSIDKNASSIQYSGAYNPLYVVRKLKTEEKSRLSKGDMLELERGTVHNNTYLLYQIRADHMPIGISEKDHNFNSTILNEGDATIYLFSDGFVDQFGGPSGKKFMSKNFKNLLLEIQELPMDKQRDKLENELVSWMGDISQIDDILVIGIKI